ncbi:hypothetical protein [Streptomyces sp. NPDC017413]|uniref:hypothetical protein n=1 Tax=unclassified Streptomyces TaxID=2593676 RepID=UPI003797F115
MHLYPGQARHLAPNRNGTTAMETARCGATAQSWDGIHPRLTHRTCWLDHDRELPIVAHVDGSGTA